jgi:hypothetical protein
LRGTQAEQGLEASHPVEATAEAEHVFVEVVLEIVGPDAVVSVLEP